jgi:hypothetical protein
MLITNRSPAGDMRSAAAGPFGPIFIQLLRRRKRAGESFCVRVPKLQVIFVEILSRVKALVYQHGVTLIFKDIDI